MTNFIIFTIITYSYAKTHRNLIARYEKHSPTIVVQISH